MLAMQTMKRYMGFISLVVVFLLILSTEARSEIYGFEAISNNSGVSGALASQLCVDVTEYGTNQVLFTFFNNGLAPYQVPSPIPSTIRLVVFDDGALLGPPDVIEGPGVVGFTEIGSEDEKVLPGGNGPPYYFQTTAGFGALADPSPAFNGVDEWDPSGSPPNPVEFVGIVFEIGGGYDFDGVLTAIDLGFTDPFNDEALRVGMHVISIGDDEDSDSFIMTPIPASMILGILGLGVAGIKLRKFA